MEKAIDSFILIELYTGNNVAGVLTIGRSWPGMLRTIYGDHERCCNVYFKPYPGYYLTGDGYKLINVVESLLLKISVLLRVLCQRSRLMVGPIAIECTA